jgi:hypothetical protein
VGSRAEDTKTSEESMKIVPVKLSFCPTGSGGGVDNSCGRGGSDKMPEGFGNVARIEFDPKASAPDLSSVLPKLKGPNEEKYGRTNEAKAEKLITEALKQGFVQTYHDDQAGSRTRGYEHPSGHKLEVTDYPGRNADPQYANKLMVQYTPRSAEKAAKQQDDREKRQHAMNKFYEKNPTMAPGYRTPSNRRPSDPGSAEEESQA